MFGASVNLESAEACSTDFVLGKHSLDGKLNSHFGLGCHKGAILDGLETADISGVMIIHLLVELLAGEDDLFGIDNNDAFAAIDVRSVFGTVFAVQNGSCRDSDITESLACGVDHVPAADNGFFFCHGCGHYLFLR